MSLILRDKIETAWRLRWNQQIEDSLQLYYELNDSAPSIEEASQSEEVFSIWTDIRLLYSSLMRSQGRHKESREILSDVRNQAEKLGWYRQRRLAFELAVKSYLERDYLAALEHFSQHVRWETDRPQRLIGIMNQLVCLEYLGFPYQRKIEEIQEELKQIGDNTAPPVPQVLRQIECLRNRELFQQGIIGTWISKETIGVLDYTQYYRQWVRCLPYHRHHKEITPEELADYTNSKSILYDRGFRLRTLKGAWSPEDLHNAHFGELSVRIYLWVWRWLLKPGNISTHNIALLIEQIAEHGGIGDPIRPDILYVKNALGWIALMDSALEDVPAFRKLQDIEATDTSYPLLQIENWCQQLIRARMNGSLALMNETYRSLHEHPLWTSGEILFADLAQAIFSNHAAVAGPLTPLAKSFLSLCTYKSTSSELKHRWIVNVEKFQLEDCKTNKKMISESLSQAVDLFSRKDVVSCDEFVSYCFGFKRYDAELHQARVFNIMARIKTFFNEELQLTMKSGRVFVTGSFDSVRIIRPSPLAAALREQPYWMAYQGRKRAQDRVDLKPLDRILKRDVTLTLEPGRDYSRKELSDILGGARSTSIRRINELIETGIILRYGMARLTRYRLSNAGIEKRNHLLEATPS